MGSFMQGLRAGLRTSGSPVAIPSGYEKAGEVVHSVSHVHSYGNHEDYHADLENELRAVGDDVIGGVCAACGRLITW